MGCVARHPGASLPVVVHREGKWAVPLASIGASKPLFLRLLLTRHLCEPINVKAFQCQ